MNSQEKGAIPFEETTPAPKDQAWDGAAETKAASIDDLKIMAAWVDSENPDVKGSYKLPHHTASSHDVVWRGVANAMARLSQTQIPEADKKAVYNHLAKHYAQFDEEPPAYKDLGEETTKFLEATIEKAEDGSFTAIASTNSVDRHGEVVDNNGWDLKAYKKNPVILWGHDHNEPAIGVAKKVWVDGAGSKAKLMIQPVLHDVTEKARAVKALVDMGVVKTLSVGFKPLESPDGVTFTKNELLEVSMVNVPANADAMMMAYKGLKDAGFEEKTIEAVGVKMDQAQMKATLQQMSEAIKTAAGHVETMQNMMAGKQVIDSQVKQSETKVEKAKVPKATEPKAVRNRLSMLKVIARASDIILEAEKKK